MKKVTVLRLSGCTYCEELVRKLNAKQVAYSTIDADIESDFADEVEDLLDVYVYPIVRIEDNAGRYKYLYRAANSKELGSKEINGGIKVGVLGIDEIVAIING